MLFEDDESKAFFPRQHFLSVLRRGFPSYLLCAAFLRSLCLLAPSLTVLPSFATCLRLSPRGPSRSS